MSIDVLLINPWPKVVGINEATVEVPLGILYIASFLKSKGVSCDIIDANVMSLEDAEVVEKTIKISPLLVGISTNAYTYQTALSYSRQIKKKNPNIIIILGGPQPTAMPEICLENLEIDAVIRGEGEEIVYGIIENLRDSFPAFKDVRGVVYRDNHRIVYNLPVSRIVDLDRLPFPAYQLLPDLKYYHSRTRKWPFMGIITSRGCAFQCAFCSKDIFGNKVTFRSPENVISEIEFLVKDKGIRQIDILDDNFTLDRNRCEKICNLILKKSLNISISLQSGVRADSLDKELIFLLKKAGVFKIAFGVESGDQDILRGIRKNINLESILKATEWSRQADMIVIGFFMIGLPYDTPKTLQKTIDFAKKMNPHIANFMVTIPYYGTSLYRLIAEKGKFLIDTRMGVPSGFYGAKAFFELGDLKKDIVEYFYGKAYRNFYFRINKIIDIIGTLRSWQEWLWLLSAAYSVLSNIRIERFLCKRIRYS